MRKVLAVALLAASINTASAEQQVIDVNPIIELFAGQLPDIRDTVRKYDEAPEGGWLTYFDKGKYQSDLNKALDYAFTAIASGLYQETRTRLLELDKAIHQGNVERSELVIKMDLAREKAEPNLVDRALMRTVPKGSREDYKQQIAKLDAEIEAVRQKRDDIIENFRERFEDEYEITLESKQAEAVLYQLNGAAIVEAVVVGKALLEVEKRLHAILTKGVDPSVARKYHGISAINRLLIVRMHERHLASYTEDWLPKLEKIERKNKREADEIKKVLRNAKSASNEAVSRANLKLREKMADIIVSYRNILLARQKTTTKAHEAAMEDAQVALQTLKALETAGELGVLYGESTAEFNALMQIKAPDLMPLDDESVLEQFIDISRNVGS
ncbi:hypothetical protein R5W60_17830 [Brucella pseudintermedia]|uniref:hypothetical protein n=1 Tax=Brucella pseudintermedia TaxID=370111 RepID=UPI000EFBCC17|nr:hypothetical protein R5W60_17830 [Brucella pseudintermedia]